MIKYLVYACVILHNMCVEEQIAEKGDGNLDEEDHGRYHDTASDPRLANESLFGRGGAPSDQAEMEFIQSMNEHFAGAFALSHH